MKNIISILRRFLHGYKRYVILSISLNLLATIFNLFSFASIIPILQILFGLTGENHSYIPLSEATTLESYIDIAQNNIYAYIEELILEYGASSALILLGVYLVTMTFFKVMSTFGGGAALVPIRTGVLRDIRNQIYNKLISLPIGYYSQERKGDIMSRMSNDVSEVENSVIASLEMLFKNPIMIIIYIAVLFYMSWRLTLFVLLLLPISGLLIGRIGRSLKKRSTKGQELNGDLLSQIEETLGGLRIIKAFNAENKLIERFQALNNNIRTTFNKIQTRYLLAHPVSEFLGTMVIAILLWYGGRLILMGNSTISAPEFIYYLVIFYSIIQPFKDLSKAGYSIKKGTASLERIDEILNAQNDLIVHDNAIKIKEFNNNIEIKNLYFKYNLNEDNWILRDINLTMKKGTTVALVGESGSGKSTLVDLIPHFYDITDGNIYIDGHEIRDIDMVSLRGLIGNVNQEPILFNDTIFNNIAFGVKNATIEEVKRAAKIANAHEFIEQLEHGYNYMVGDRGMLLSGGQRQRICIARAILKNPPILILDEATSALDTESEKLVQAAIEKLMEHRTTIVIAHRLSTIKSADIICVMDKGAIIETGTHDELIRKNGKYKKLYDIQFNTNKN